MKQTELTHYGYRKSVRRLFSGVLCLIAFTFHLLIVFGQSSPAQAYEVSRADQLGAIESLCESDLCSLSALDSETWPEHKAHIGLQTCEQDKLSPNVVWIVSPSSTPTTLPVQPKEGAAASRIIPARNMKNCRFIVQIIFDMPSAGQRKNM